jgi:hypothetical protein
MSYFFTSRAESVPLPAPGLPNINIRKILPSFCSAERKLLRPNDNALDDDAEWEIERVVGMWAIRIEGARANRTVMMSVK